MSLHEKDKGPTLLGSGANLEEDARQSSNTPYVIRYFGFEQVLYPSPSLNKIESLLAAEASRREIPTWHSGISFRTIAKRNEIQAKATTICHVRCSLAV
jgi:hypothetical protein